MRILDLAIKDLRQILRERQSAFFLLIMPVAFTILFGFAFGGFSAGGDEGDPRLPLGLLNEDGGVVAGHLVDLLRQSDVLRPQAFSGDREALADQVAAGDLAAALVIPAGYGERLASGEDVVLTLIVDGASPTGFTLQGAVEAAVGRLRSALAAARIAADQAAAHGLLERGQTWGAVFEESLARAVAAWAAPPVTVQTGSTGAPAGAADDVYGDNAFAQTSPGMMAQFVMAGLITASQVLVLERKSGSLRRLLTTNMTRPGILVGHFLAMFLMIVAQLLVLILFGALLLRLPYFREPGATLLLLLATALFAASMGLLIGVMARSEEQAVVFSLVPMFLLAGLGGAWMPLEFTPDSVQRVAYLTPIAWMMDGFKDILVRGQGLGAVLPAVGVLLGYAVLLWLLAAWRFRRLAG